MGFPIVSSDPSSLGDALRPEVMGKGKGVEG